MKGKGSRSTRETASESRKGVFSPHVLQAAQTNAVALVNSVELYSVVCAVLSGEIVDCAPIREAILGASGYVNLRRFYKKSPFETT